MASDFDGVIPAPDIRAIIDKTAAHIGKKAEAAALEAKIRARAETDARFKFLNSDDAYHPYYIYKLNQARAGDQGTATPLGGQDQPSIEVVADDGRPSVPRPGDFDFLMDQPRANPVDLDILRLTALFVARNGRRFQSDLSQREATNYQFDFLQPSHSLFGYFNRLVAQYVKVLQPDDFHLQRLTLKSAPLESSEERKADARRNILSEVSDRVQWGQWETERARQREDDAEARRKAYAEIDWQDFVVVTTVEFTEADDLLDLPPPARLEEIETMTIRQRKMAAMIMEGKQVAPEPEEDTYIEPQAADDMQVSDDERPAAKEDSAMKIRKDYVPKGTFEVHSHLLTSTASRSKRAAMTTCSICGLQVPEDEINEHVRIELLDPKWKEKLAQAERNRSAANLLPGGANVSEALNRFAKQRSDLFGSSSTEAQKRQLAEKEDQLRRSREAVVWDGHAVSAGVTSNRFQQAAMAGQGDLQQQIRDLRRQHGVNVDNSQAPDIGPATPAQQKAREVAAEAQRKAYDAMREQQKPTKATGNVAPHSLVGANMAAAPIPGLQTAAETRPADGAPEGEPAAKRTKQG